MKEMTGETVEVFYYDDDGTMTYLVESEFLGTILKVTKNENR